ncbi:hypothetical protein FXO37_21325, partial [Capsicum annuum]
MQDSSEGKSTRDVQVTIREALGSKKEASRKESEAGFQEFPDNSDEDEADFDARMRQQILKRRKELGDPPSKQKLLSENGNARNRSPSPTRCGPSLDPANAGCFVHRAAPAIFLVSDQLKLVFICGHSDLNRQKLFMW